VNKHLYLCHPLVLSSPTKQMFGCSAYVQSPSGLRRGSAVVLSLGLWFRIPSRAWMSVCLECCQVEVSATSWSLVGRSLTDCSLSVIVKPRKWGGPGPLGDITSLVGGGGIGAGEGYRVNHGKHLNLIYLFHNSN